MLIESFAAGMFQTNCYVVATGPGAQAVIIDPGQDAAPQVDALVARHGLRPEAVILTHGHLDHTWNAAPVCERYRIPCHIHPADIPMLRDPTVGIGRALSSMLPLITYEPPRDVVELTDRVDLTVAGLRFTVDAAPGHTQGSVLLTIHNDASPDVVFSGDVLFAGSIGRTDLPGGNHAQLLRSIAERLLIRTDDTLVLPGHGPHTTIGAERAANPFLADLVAVVQQQPADYQQKGRHGL